MRIEFTKDQAGNWVASMRVPPDGLASCVAATPWTASAMLCDCLCDDVEIAWNDLPWSEVRIAYGIVMGVAELFGATLGARLAINAAMPDEPDAPTSECGCEYCEEDP